MHRIGVIVCGALFVFAGNGCSGQDLREDDVLAQIRGFKDYPQCVALELGGIDSGSALGKEISRLEQDKYVRRTSGGGYEITQAGSTMVRGLYWNSVYSMYDYFRPCGYEADVADLIDIVIDSDEGVAIVDYYVDISPTPYLDRLRSVAPGNIARAESHLRTRLRDLPVREQVQFRRWDNGWRIEE